MEGKWLKRTAWSMLSRVPWLRRRVHKVLWWIKARRAYKQRSQDLPLLLDSCNAKRRKNCGPKHIILIVVDCMRKGNLSLYGYHRETTPFLSSIADRAAVFENAITASPWTHPAVASMLTGLYPHNHGGVLPKNPCQFGREVPNKVSRNVLALPEVLTALDFNCHFLSAVMVAALPSIAWSKQICVFPGRAQRHVNELIRRLDKDRDKNTFVYFHLADLHIPVDVPISYRESFGKIAEIPQLRNWQFQENACPGEPDFERYRENRCKLYDCALRSVDAQLGRFFRYLEEAQLLDSSLVLVTADHGEEFWEHVETERELFYNPRCFFGVGHGQNLFQELINVPLMCVGPGVPSGRYSHNVSLVDLVPTVLDICGIEHQIALDGRNLFDCSDERALISEAVAYGYEKKAVVQKNWKLIHSEGDGVSLLFDLCQDPKEKRDLAEINPEKVQELKGHLPRTEVKGETLEIDRDIKKQLQALGYM